MKRLDDPFFDVTAPIASGYLERESGHRVYWEESGAADGAPIVLVHGGPGGANQPGMRRFVDPAKFRIIQFDQRGCGKSEPAGELSANTLQATIADMEALRIARRIDRWIVSGGSWGSAVALAYGEAHPERCLGLLLVSMWLCRPRDTQWWFHGVRTVFPELWDEFARHVPECERTDLRSAYCTRILQGDAETAAAFARRLYLYEEGFMRFAAPLAPADPARGEAYGRIFAHYAANDFFLRDDQLLAQAEKVAHLPAIIITGRYDMCTPPDNAYDLAKLLPKAELRIIAGAGHYPTEERMSLACVAGVSDILARIQPPAERKNVA